MAIEPGELLASGRAADVFDQGDGTVLRRYRTEYDTEAEGALMSWLADGRYPVPAVHRAGGRDIVMDRVEGPTMLEDLERRPWRAFTHMRTLARLQREMNALEAPPWLPAADTGSKGSAVLHLDLHPMNVIVSPDGPVVIDWTNARRGAPGFDAAMSFVLMAAFEPTGAKEILAQRLVTGAFRRYRGTDLIARHMAEAARFRLLDQNVTAGERRKLDGLAKP